MEQIYPMYKMGESESAERAGPSSPVPMRLELWIHPERQHKYAPLDYGCKNLFFFQFHYAVSETARYAGGKGKGRE